MSSRSHQIGSKIAIKRVINLCIELQIRRHRLLMAMIWLLPHRPYLKRFLYPTKLANILI